MTAHRERKKEQTRQALISAAHKLFAKKGYDATTLAEITAAANCAPRTFFQYFDSKEDLLLVGIDIFWDDFAETLAQRSGETSALQATREWVLGVTKDFLACEQPFAQTLDREAANTNLSARARTQLYSMQCMKEILVPELAKDLQLAPDAAEPRLLAAATAAILDAYHTDKVLAVNDPMTFINKAFATLEGAMTHLINKRVPYSNELFLSAKAGEPTESRNATIT